MYYDKGPQITVGKLKEYLSYIPDDVPVEVGMGDNRGQLHYLENNGGALLLLPDCYMENAEVFNMKTVISLMQKNK